MHLCIVIDSLPESSFPFVIHQQAPDDSTV